MDRSPEEAFRRMLELLEAKDMDDMAQLWAPDGMAEFPFAEGRSVRTSAPYRIDYATVITVRDGAITEYRDCWSPVQTARAGGDLVALRKGLQA